MPVSLTKPARLNVRLSGKETFSVSTEGVTALYDAAHDTLCVAFDKKIYFLRFSVFTHADGGSEEYVDIFVVNPPSKNQPATNPRDAQRAWFKSLPQEVKDAFMAFLDYRDREAPCSRVVAVA
jgi:hypothetical protein